MITATLGLLLTAIGALTGCGETCQTTCRHVYDPSECGIQRPGTPADELIDDCVSECMDAMARPGGLEDEDGITYDPEVNNPVQETWVWSSDAQAAAWIDCVWTLAPDDGPQASCAQLDPKVGGKCQPI